MKCVEVSVGSAVKRDEQKAENDKQRPSGDATI